MFRKSYLINHGRDVQDIVASLSQYLSETEAALLRQHMRKEIKYYDARKSPKNALHYLTEPPQMATFAQMGVSSYIDDPFDGVRQTLPDDWATPPEEFLMSRI